MILSLCYHDIVAGSIAESGFPGADAGRYKLSRAEFGRHLDALEQAGVKPGGTFAAESGDDDVYLTFDDGGAGAESCAELLERRGWRGHFFIVTDRIGTRGFLSAAAIAALHRNGHLIGSHSCSHPPRLSYEAPETIAREWRESAAVLADIIGAPVVSAAVPGGFYSRMVGKMAEEAGYRGLFTSEPVPEVGRVGNCRIFGRYGVMRGADPHMVAALAAGRIWPRWRQWAYWNLKKPLKVVGGEHWLRFRKEWLARTAG